MPITLSNANNIIGISSTDQLSTLTEKRLSSTTLSDKRNR